MKGTGRMLMVVVILVAAVAIFAIGNRVGTVSALQTLKEDSQATQRPRYPVWEYRAVSVPNVVSAEKMLNEMGKQGWELVVVQSGVGSGAMPVQGTFYTNVHYILKRAVQ